MRSARKPAAIEEGLLLRPGGAAQRRVAVREPPEATDDVGVSLGIFRELIVAVAAREREAAFLIDEIFRVLEWQIEELALDMRDLSVEPASDGATGAPMRPTGLPARSPRNMLRGNWSSTMTSASAPSGVFSQGASLPSRPVCQRQEKRAAISASKAASFSNHLSGPAARQNARTSMGPIASVVPGPAITAAPLRS